MPAITFDHEYNPTMNSGPALRFLMFFFVILLTLSCNNDKPQPRAKPGAERMKEPLLRVNQYLARSEDEQIDAYAARHNWKMYKTGTGLRYQVYKQGQGQAAAKDKTVVISYTLGLLTGEQCYSSAKDGPMKFVLGKGQAVNGLEEAIFLMRVGDRAKLIVPSHLAYGVPGDQKKIPPKAALIYDIEFLSIK
jgi:FKBP-type peptidyl-prolyl cis-trans isomerase FkpA